MLTTHAPTRISQEGILFFERPEIPKTCSKTMIVMNCEYRLSSRLGALTPVSMVRIEKKGSPSAPPGYRKEVAVWLRK